MSLVGKDFFKTELDFIKTKRCPKCDTVKPLSDFHKHKLNGVQYHCKKCRNKGGLGFSRAAQELMLEMGMTRPELGTPCTICKRIDQPLVFDHCHKTKQFRGWLCRGCNSTLGIIGDSESGIKKFLKPFLEYLKK